MNESTADLGLLDRLPPEWSHDLMQDISARVADSSRKVVVCDDDPTGTQTVQGIPVLTEWSEEVLRRELLGEYPAFYILTNSRSLTEAAACRLADELGGNLRRASAATGVNIVPISRSDSTLRGHFPAEVDALANSLGKTGNPCLIIPFFLEGGRYTVDNVHYVQDGSILVPAAQTAFARDAVFGFASSELREWVEEKTNGRIRSGAVQVISIDDLRCGGPDRVAAMLAALPAGGTCIVNAASYRDMQVLVSALLTLEDSGREFLYRTAASFVRTRIGLDHHTLLLPAEKLTSGAQGGGLFVVGSYVEKTGRQLAALLDEPGIVALEVRVDQLLDEHGRQAEIDSISGQASEALSRGRDCVLYTSRRLVTGSDADSSLAIGKIVSDSLIAIVGGLAAQPRYLLAKGGITSSDVATRGLGVRRAMIIGQALPGVPVWRLGAESRYPGTPYIVFPGNVGDDDALATLRRRLSAGPAAS
ncbi:hypothetical protein KQH41_01105 [bacterium]|nr:hypothetical protein [bacterium]